MGTNNIGSVRVTMESCRKLPDRVKIQIEKGLGRVGVELGRVGVELGRGKEKAVKAH